MVGAIVLSPTDAASQEPVVGSAQRVVVARARAPRDVAVQHCLEYLGSWHPDFELEGSARSVVQFEGVLPEAAPCFAYAPVDLDGQVGVVVDVSSKVYKLVRLVVHLAIEGRLNEGPRLQRKHKDENEAKQNKHNTRKIRHDICKPNARRAQDRATCV